MHREISQFTTHRQLQKEQNMSINNRKFRWLFANNYSKRNDNLRLITQFEVGNWMHYPFALEVGSWI